MEVFNITIINVLITVLYIIPGYVLGKVKKIDEEHLASISSLLVYICMPLLIIGSFLSMKDFNSSDFIQMTIFFFVSLALQILFFSVLFLFLRKKYSDARIRLFNIGSCLGNVGFFGLPIIKAVLSQYQIVSCFSCVYVCSMNILVFTIGVFAITQDKKYISLKKALLNPASIGLIIALPLYLLSAYKYFPVQLTNAINVMGSMTTPLCMIILGVRLSTTKIINLFNNGFAYLTILMKMIIFPIVCYFIVRYIPVLSFEFKASILILSAVPCASMVANLAEMVHHEEETSCNMVVLSTICSVITIPLVSLLLNI
jgi:predicted permease